MIEKYLGCFDQADRAEVELLTSSLKIVNLSSLQNDMCDAVLDIIKENKTEKQSVIIDAISAYEDIKKWWGNGTRIDRKLNKTASELALYTDFQPSEVIHYDSGSEHFSAVVRRDVKNRSKQDVVQENPNELKRNTYTKLHLIFIVDNSGSGRQVADFLQLAVRSLGTIFPEKQEVQITVMSWGATRTAIAKINDLITELLISEKDSIYKLKIVFKYLNYINTIYDFSDQVFLGRLREILIKYGPVREPFGYYDVASLTLFEGHKCPNTIPRFYYSRRGSIDLLFPARVVSTDVAANLHRHFGKSIKAEFKNSHLTRFKRSNLLLAFSIARKDASMPWLFLCYAAIGETNDVSMALLDCSQGEKITIRNSLRQKKWIDIAGRSTEIGNLALRAYARRNRHRAQRKFSKYSAAQFDGEIVDYYPQSVDGVG